MANEAIAYDKSDLRGIVRSFKAMDEQATIEAKKQSNALAQYAADKIKVAAGTRLKAGASAQRIADGVKISKSSKIGEFSYGFASQKYSGGATTQMVWGGMEFGSKRFKQFPTYNKQGYFIYPTLRQIQPDIIRQWEEAFDGILKEWG